MEKREPSCNADFAGGSDSKASAYSEGNPGSIPGGEDLLEKEMATHSSILAWKIQWMEELGRLQSMESQRGIGWRGRWEGGSGWEIHVNPWLIHVNV